MCNYNNRGPLKKVEKKGNGRGLVEKNEGEVFKQQVLAHNIGDGLKVHSVIVNTHKGIDNKKEGIVVPLNQPIEDYKIDRRRDGNDLFSRSYDPSQPRLETLERKSIDSCAVD